MINVNEQMEAFVDKLVAQGVPLVDILVEFEMKVMALKEQIDAMDEENEDDETGEE